MRRSEDVQDVCTFSLSPVSTATFIWKSVLKKMQHPFLFKPKKKIEKNGMIPLFKESLAVFFLVNK